MRKHHIHAAIVACNHNDGRVPPPAHPRQERRKLLPACLGLQRAQRGAGLLSRMTAQSHRGLYSRAQLLGGRELCTHVVGVRPRSRGALSSHPMCHQCIPTAPRRPLPGGHPPSAPRAASSCPRRALSSVLSCSRRSSSSRSLKRSCAVPSEATASLSRSWLRGKGGMGMGQAGG